VKIELSGVFCVEMMRPVALEMGAWTTACTTPESRNPWAWTKFLLLAPCPQHVLISSLHLIFVALLAIYAVTRLIAVRRARASAAHQNGFSKLSSVHISPIYSAQVAFIVLVMVFQWCIALWRVVYWRRVPAQELLYSLSQALAWTVFAAVVGHQKKLRATVHSKPLRVWWIMTFVFSLLTQYTSIARYVRNDPRDVHLWVDGVLSMATFPVIVLLALVAVVGRTGISVDDGGLTESLLGSVSDDAVGVTEFASASFISKLMWLWLNPLLRRGRFKALELEDVPLLAPEDRSEVLYSRFVDSFESQPSVKRALLHTFWPQLVFTAFLSVAKLSVMYVGPILITQFVSYVAGNELFPHEGLVLVVILFTGKMVEVLSAHHYNFYSQRLSMVVRSSLVTAVYRKGLCLSSFARQTHGVGQIVNYTSVDVQQVADFMVQIHNLWVLPLQAAVALVILYAVIGISCFGGILVMLCILFLSFNVAKFHRGYQAMVMKFKDKRMAITTEVLNNMKIIKLQVCYHTLIFIFIYGNLRAAMKFWSRGRLWVDLQVVRSDSFLRMICTHETLRFGRLGKICSRKKSKIYETLSGPG
jgi:ATP-binding cassette subfamily C (CFTR/MRP) protein 2